MKPFPDELTIGEKYDSAMKITTQDEADEWFEACVEHTMRISTPPVDRAKAESIERANLGYYAGYYPPDVNARVQRLFRCAHPIFGTLPIGK